MFGTKRNGLKRKLVLIIVKYNDGEMKCLGAERVVVIAD